MMLPFLRQALDSTTNIGLTLRHTDYAQT